MNEKKNPVALQSVVLPETAGVSLSTFMSLVQKLELSAPEVGLFVDMVEVHKLSVHYVGKLINSGVGLHYVHAAYLLRDKLGPLYDPNTSVGKVTSEFMLPVDKACELLTRIFSECECDDDEYVEAAARLLLDIADRCPQIVTWSSILDVLVDAHTHIERAIEAQGGSLLDQPPDEKIEMVISIIDELGLVPDRRL